MNKSSIMIKKADIILAAALIIVGIAMSYFLSFGQDTGSELIISCDGEKFGSYSLYEDREIVIERDDHINKVTIKNGTVSMSFSDCHGQDCIHQGEITKSGEAIICLPNKVVLEIEGGEAEYDTLSK